MMSTEIRGFLNELHPEIDFALSEDFIEEGLLDSFDLVALVTMLEERFSIYIDALDVVPENFGSVEAISALVRKSGGAE